MIRVTQSAVEKLKALIVEHPEDPIVRVKVRDLKEGKIRFQITLEEEAQPEDEVQVIQGLMVAIEGHSAPRLGGITIDYQESDGFKFTHPDPGEQQNPLKLDFFNMN